MRRAFEFRAFFPVDHEIGRSRHERGFTLVEMIISIVITGIVVSMVAMFGRGQIGAYMDATNRAELADAADTALRRIARELQSALPNSVRQSGNFLEFVPIHDAGRYRAEVNSTGGGNILDFTSNTDASFEVLGPTVTVLVGDQLVIYNLGLPGSDVYAGTSRRAATAGSGLSTITFAPAGVQFPLASPQSRFQVVGSPVTYECAGGSLLRHSGYGFQAAQPVAFGALGGVTAVIADNVSACSFNYAPAVLQRNGLVVMRLTLTRNGESVELLHQVDVQNTP
ncbi:MAG: ral secretion pathway protein [Proteobacteria bacterium]|nr:ral secretion pathway protein [Pseudomonadota bacterium]